MPRGPPPETRIQLVWYPGLGNFIKLFHLILINAQGPEHCCGGISSILSGEDI